MAHVVCERCGDPIPRGKALCFTCASILGVSDVADSATSSLTELPKSDREVRSGVGVLRLYWTGTLRVMVEDEIEEAEPVATEQSKGFLAVIVSVFTRRPRPRWVKQKRTRPHDREGGMEVTVGVRNVHVLAGTPEGDEQVSTISRREIRGIVVERYPPVPGFATDKGYRVLLVVEPNGEQVALPLISISRERAEAIATRLTTALVEVPDVESFRG